MKAIVIHQYGGPEELKLEERPDPVPGEGQVLVRLSATSINPVDIKRRTGEAKSMFPVNFPGILGADASGTILELGPGVEGFAVGDRVFGMAIETYAELCVASAATLAKIPDGLDIVEAAALPLVVTTGSQLITVGTDIKAGQTVLISGAAGSVGRTAVFTAKERGATVIAGVRQSQAEDAESLGADQVVALDDEAALSALPPVDAVADAVGGKTATVLLGKVKPGGVFASVLGPPQGADAHPNVKIVPVQAKPDPQRLVAIAEAVRDGKLTIPIGQKLPLAQAKEGQEAVEKGGAGKVLLVMAG